MKHCSVYAVLAALILTTGCTKKNEDGTTEIMSTEEVVEKVQTTTLEVAEKAEILAVKAEEVMSDLNMSVADIKTKVASYDVNKLTAYAGTYKEVILEKKDQIAAMKDKVTGLSMTDALGEKGKALKSQLAQYTDQSRSSSSSASIPTSRATSSSTSSTGSLPRPRASKSST